MNTRKLSLLVISAALATASLAGCNRGPDPAKVRAEAAYDVAKANCEAQTGDAEKSCKDQAKAQYDQAVAAAKQKNDQVKG